MLDLSSLKASIVLSAMVAGLLKSKDDPIFTVEMASFGHVENQLCYGCASTLTLAEMFGQGRSASEMMIDYTKTQFEDYVFAFLSDILPFDPSRTKYSLDIYTLKNLERAVDRARLGDVSRLIELFTGGVNKSFNDRWLLKDENWEVQLPIVKATIAEMAAAGY